MKPLIFFACGLIAQVASGQTPTIRVLDYPAAGYGLLNFSVLTDGAVLLPYKGGVYMPGVHLWYYPPNKGENILSACPSFGDESLFVVVQARSGPQVLRLSKDAAGQEETEQMALLPRGVYTVFPRGRDRFYLWGYAARRFGVWYQQGSRRDTLFASDRPITAMTPVGDASVFIAHERTVFLLQRGQPVQKISRFDSVIDGLAVGPDGALFVSSQRGIVRIRGKDQIDLIANDVHGYLQWRGKALYVLDQPRSRVLQIEW